MQLLIAYSNNIGAHLPLGKLDTLANPPLLISIVSKIQSDKFGSKFAIFLFTFCFYHLM